jgi:hypothetical protein
MGAGKESTSVTVTASSDRITVGETVSVAGTLTDSAGVPLASRPIRTYVKEGKDDWLEGPSTTTAPDGTFAFSLAPESNLKVAVIYDGDAGTWGSESSARILVAPAVTLQPEGGAVDVVGTYHYPPGTTQIRFAGSVAPRHPGRAIEIRISKMGADGRFSRVDEGSVVLGSGGRYGFDWDVVDPGVGGTYQARSILPKHNDHTWGASPVATFVIDPQP